jgi:hypothetical protein
VFYFVVFSFFFFFLLLFSVVSTLKRLQSNVGALNSLKVVSKDNRITMQMAKAYRNPKEPENRPVEGTKWATLGRSVPFPDLEEVPTATSSDTSLTDSHLVSL